MPLLPRTKLSLFAFGVLLTVTGCHGCEKKAAPDVSTATPEPSASAAVAASAEPATPAAAAKGVVAAKGVAATTVAASSSGAAAIASAAPSASASSALTTTAAAPSAVASAAPAPGPSGTSTASSDIPKPCNDGFGRLGRITFTDLGGGKVRVTGSNNASANCSRVAPTQYQCDWVVDGKPTGSFGAKFDPAHKSVNGSIAKGKMFSCPPSSQS